MSIELILFIVMVGTFFISCFVFKTPVSIGMVLAAVITTIISGNGIPISQLVEGTFGYIDTILVITSAMIFMKYVQRSGALDVMNVIFVDKFHKKPAILLIMLMFIVMFPGMITGSSTAAVISAGAIVYPILILMGIPKEETAAIIAIGGLMGMIAPPINVPAMIIGGGIDMPYVGFTIPLLILTVPLAIFSVLFLGYTHSKDLDYEMISKKLNHSVKEKHGIKIFFPIALVLLLLIGSRAFPKLIPNLGMPLIFLIGAAVASFSGERFKLYETAKEGVKDSLPVMGILMGVGMLVQVMTLTGVRGYIVATCLSVPPIMLYLAIAVTVPLFGAISSYGAASVLCVPFLLALINNDQIVTGSALSLIASLGDLMPPTALAGIFAAKICGVENYFEVLKKCKIPALVTIAWGMIALLGANQIASIMP
ncbi:MULTISPECIES: SLC13 family permease [unclassified Fusibacter]|uniref:SLC13 family permease n=1 Tax=unclassified Fusibacter TaxID=2624464 RepID=UPI001010CA2D|nr:MULTISPECIES: SLC13 family permease [unclassified Fusibacter]MCK8061067.1 TRAP transporter large permease subunit [Fusibacter sp. A2]NPE20479.1 TRAP transporter large permease subunit [Fusibacter sp. A1]RXV63683.1 TRAP transporter large permease [Fusibacter sp. A1]